MERRNLFSRLPELRADDDAKSIVGYAAVWYRPDDKGTEYPLWRGFIERIAEGAFDDVLKDDVRGLFNHNVDHLLGRLPANTLRLSVDEMGLRYEIDVPDTQTGRDVLTLVSRGDVTGSSFSFDVGVTEYEDLDDATTIRTIKSVKRLYDVGPVTFPAYTSTDVVARSKDVIMEDYRQQTSRGDLRKVETTLRLARLAAIG